MPLKLQQRGVYCVERESGLLHFERERERERDCLVVTEVVEVVGLVEVEEG